MVRSIGVSGTQYTQYTVQCVLTSVFKGLLPL